MTAERKKERIILDGDHFSSSLLRNKLQILGRPLHILVLHSYRTIPRIFHLYHPHRSFIFLTNAQLVSMFTQQWEIEREKSLDLFLGSLFLFHLVFSGSGSGQRVKVPSTRLNTEPKIHSRPSHKIYIPCDHRQLCCIITNYRQGTHLIATTTFLPWSICNLSLTIKRY